MSKVYEKQETMSSEKTKRALQSFKIIMNMKFLPTNF